MQRFEPAPIDTEPVRKSVIQSPMFEAAAPAPSSFMYMSPDLGAYGSDLGLSPAPAPQVEDMTQTPAMMESVPMVPSGPVVMPPMSMTPGSTASPSYVPLPAVPTGAPPPKPPTSFWPF